MEIFGRWYDCSSKEPPTFHFCKKLLKKKRLPLENPYGSLRTLATSLLEGADLVQIGHQVFLSSEGASKNRAKSRTVKLQTAPKTVVFEVVFEDEGDYSMLP